MSDKKNSSVYDSIIANIIQKIKTIHVEEDTSVRIVDYLSDQVAKGKYQKMDKTSRFCEELTKDLQTFTHDYHLSVYYDPDGPEAISTDSDIKPDDKYSVNWWAGVDTANYGIPKLEYLMGNVGYIKIIYFAPVPIAGEMVVTAMNYLSTADALIFDLRECSGGDPNNVMMFESYLFDAFKNPKHLLTRHCRVETPPQQQFWTYPYMPGKRLPDIPVAILTSCRTFSGGEDMAYTMKHHNRAIIVGEKTAGGAHMVKRVPVGSGCMLRVPYAHPVNPVTGTDWEGIGVIPDLEVTKDDALMVAHKELFYQMREAAEDPQIKHKNNWYLQRVVGLYQPVQVSEETLKQYLGVYRDWQVRLEEGRLYLHSPNGLHRDEMIPLSDNLFMVDEAYNARFRIGDDGLADALVWIGRDSDKEIIYELSE